ncbi:MAG: type 2 isopentenyl-diphosphate Delta-isomerase [Candidatus Eremiobacteraeota bacterium]|nr:type 2 isopentenyl-diphosphate Delta-isomerase [Candidatus Eremiobacteraeota bacterium]
MDARYVRRLENELDGTPSRKADHIRINLEQDVRAKGVTSGFEAFRFKHCALPEIDLSDVSTHCTLFGKALNAPLLISSMTGGTAEAQTINRTLAAVAQKYRIAIGLGSGRALLEHPELLPTFDVRAIAPDALLFANIGAVQLNRGYGVSECKKIVALLQADALILHLNPLQEALQVEGDTAFAGLRSRIEALCKAIEVPVVVKEVGWGLSAEVARALFDAGVSAVDVAGAGGTSWSEVERHRLFEPWRANVAASFATWGIPTADCLIEARAAAPSKIIFASGGVRDGIDVAKAIALGADAVGVAAPFLHAAADGDQAADRCAQQIIETLRVAMFSVGARTAADLRANGVLRRS